jgi:hypothetical protein
MNNFVPARTEFLKRALIAVTALWAAFMISVAVFHTWQIYNPTSVWDMWHAYLEFYERVSDGDWSAWWMLHNEHRLILAYLIFWADIRWFHGGSVLMLAANYVLDALLVTVFWLLLARRIPRSKFGTTWCLLGLFTTASLFLLCQGESLTWSQTNQFWFVFLLPLCALYFAQKSCAEGDTRSFVIACAFGVLAVGAMASGLLVLPLLAAFAILTRQRISRIGILLLLSVIFILLYRSGSTGEHPLLSPALFAQPLKASLYALTILGSPFAFLFEGNPPYIAETFGLVFVICAVYKAAKTLPKPRLDPLQTAIVFYVLYVLVTVAGITNGRMSQDIQATSGRYTTVALVGWASLLTLYSRRLATEAPKWKTLLALVALPLMFLMAKAQIKALSNWDEPIFEAKAATLGLALGVRDFKATSQIAGPGWAVTLVPRVADKAYYRHLSVFGWFPFRNLREQLGTVIASPPGLQVCQGSIDGIETISDSRFFGVSGRLVNSANDQKVKSVRFLDMASRDLGAAIMGETTPDLDENLRKRLLDQRFRGYVLASATGTNVIVQGENSRGPVCRMNAVIPAALYSFKPVEPQPDQVTVDSSNILPANGWTGADSFHTNLCSSGLRIYGSFVDRGDSDVGSISLRLKRGDSLLYRSGPIDGHQVMEIAGQPPVILPVALTWIELAFSGPDLPKDQFVVKFTDSGSGWGEWSAIAVRDTASCTTALLPPATAPEKVTVAKANILDGNGWTGSDAFHTNLCSAGLKIYGSFKEHGDADSGSISLRVRRGDRLLYRSGPKGGRQILEIDGRPQVVLPVTTEWSMLDFSRFGPLQSQFVAKFTDGGTGWGEWSAVALRDSTPCPK